MSRPGKVFTALLFLLLLSGGTSASAQKKMIVVTVNTVTIQDLLKNECIKRIAENGVLGLMNTKSNGKNNQYKPYLTLGTGERSEVRFDCLECVMISNENKSVYEDITLKECREGNIVNLSINRLWKINSDTLYDAEPGKLGETLKSNNITRCFIGGFWYNNSIKSPAFFVGMDSSGLVDMGEIPQVFGDGGIDTEKVLDAFEKYKETSDFIVIELGDTESLYANKSLHTEESYNLNKENILNKCGKIIEYIAEDTDMSNTALCIVSPYSSGFKVPNTELLSPFIFYDGGKSRGVFTSETTKRNGIVSALDFAPFVLDYYGISRQGFTGHTMKHTVMDNHLEYIQKLNDIITFNSIWRLPILKAFALLILAVLIVYSLKILAGLKIDNRIMNFFMIFCLLLPAVFLLEAAFKIEYILYKVLFMVLISAALTVFISVLIKNDIHRVIAITAVNVLGLAADLLSGENLLRYSVFSYDPIIGARYYGMGNEYLGIMIGCTLIFCGCMMESNSRIKPLLIPLLLSISLLTGLPNLGCNVGGFITSVICFGTYLMLEYNHDIKSALRKGFLLSIFLICIFIFINMFIRDKSHLGNMFEQINTRGVYYLSNIILRKLNMALRLIRSTIWTRVLIALIIVAAISIIMPHNHVRKLFLKINHLKNAYAGIIIGCITAIAVNDSGIVTSAIIMLYGVFSFILILSSLEWR